MTNAGFQVAQSFDGKMIIAGQSMAAAAFATAFLTENLVMSRHTALFESLGDETIHLIRHILQYVLSGHKSLNTFMGISLILQILKFTNFLMF